MRERERWVGDRELAWGVAWWFLRWFQHCACVGRLCISSWRKGWNWKGLRLLALSAFAVALLLSPFFRLFLVSPLLHPSFNLFCFFPSFSFSHKLIRKVLVSGFLEVRVVFFYGVLMVPLLWSLKNLLSFSWTILNLFDTSFSVSSFFPFLLFCFEELLLDTIDSSLHFLEILGNYTCIIVFGDKAHLDLYKCHLWTARNRPIISNVCPFLF